MTQQRPKVGDAEQPNAPVEPEVPYQPTEPDEPDVQQPVTAVHTGNADSLPDQRDASNDALAQSSMHLKIPAPDTAASGLQQSITGKDEQPEVTPAPDPGNGLNIVLPGDKASLAVQPGRRGHEISRPTYH